MQRCCRIRSLRVTPLHSAPACPGPQVEAHPYWRNQGLIDFAASKGIHVTAYSPLGSPDSAAIVKRAGDAPRLMEDPVVAGVASRLGKSTAQV